MNRLNQAEIDNLQKLINRYKLNQKLLLFMSGKCLYLDIDENFPKTEQGIFNYIRGEKQRGFSRGLEQFLADSKRDRFHSPLFTISKRQGADALLKSIPPIEKQDFVNRFEQYLLVWTYLVMVNDEEIDTVFSPSRVNSPFPKKKQYNKKTSIISIVLIVAFSLTFLFSAVALLKRRGAEKNYAKNKSVIDQRIESIKLDRKKIPVSQYEDGMKEAEDIISALNEEYNTENIIAYFEAGPIKEPVVHAESVDDFLWGDYNREKNYNGSVTLFHINTGVKDPVLALFGHAMLDNTRFGVLQNGEKLEQLGGPDIIKDGVLYTKELGKENFDLVYVATFDEQIFNEAPTWTFEGVRKLKDSSPNNLIFKEDFDEIKTSDRFIVLSTCADPWGLERTIAIYRLNKNKSGYKKEDIKDGELVTEPAPLNPNETVPQDIIDSVERPGSLNTEEGQVAPSREPLYTSEVQTTTAPTEAPYVPRETVQPPPPIVVP